MGKLAVAASDLGEDKWVNQAPILPASQGRKEEQAKRPLVKFTARVTPAH